MGKIEAGRHLPHGCARPAQSIGNKSLLTYYECDDCNRSFGQGCENDFGNWSLPMRTMSRINGKEGIPSLKQGPGNAWRVDEHATGLKINVEETEGFGATMLPIAL